MVHKHNFVDILQVIGLSTSKYLGVAYYKQRMNIIRLDQIQD